jgi:transposase
MAKQGRYPRELRERAVRMVQEHRGEYTSLWQATQSIAGKFGMHQVTLYEWVKRAAATVSQSHSATRRSMVPGFPAKPRLTCPCASANTSGGVATQ